MCKARAHSSSSSMDQQLSVPAPPPPYFDRKYMQRALAHAYNSDKLHIESCHIEGINQRGENFCSDIYRVRVTYRKSDCAPIEQKTLILKDLLPALAELGSNELHMFQQVLPAMARILQDANIEAYKLNANCLFAERALAKEIYLLEDLNALGYRSADRCTGLTLGEALICMHKMAQFHAASLLLLQQKPQLADQLSPSHYADGVEDVFAQAIILDGTAFAADVVADWPHMADIANKMRSQLPKAYGRRMVDVVNPQRAVYNVIVHGDLWVNNILMSKQTQRAIFVDFQNCFVGSPAIDLQFFFYTSLQLEVLLHQRQALLQHYYTSFTQTLHACHYVLPIPDYDTLLGELQRCLFYGYYAAVCELPICCASRAAAEDFTVHTFGDPAAMLAKRQQLYANERVRSTLKATLPQFAAQGILDL